MEVIASLEKLLKRQDEQEVLAIYGAGSYILAEPYKTKFGCDSAGWHSWNLQRKKQHVDAMRKFKPSISHSFSKPTNCGRKPGHNVRQRKRLNPDVITDRLENVSPPKMVFYSVDDDAQFTYNDEFTNNDDKFICNTYGDDDDDDNKFTYNAGKRTKHNICRSQNRPTPDI